MHRVQRVVRSPGGGYLRTRHKSQTRRRMSPLGARLTSGLGLVGRFPEPLFELLQVDADGGDRSPEHPSTPLRLGVGQALLSDHDQAEPLLRLARRLLCRDGVRTFLNQRHLLLFVVVRLCCHSRSPSGELWWARDEQHVETLDVVDGMGFLQLDLRSVEEVDVPGLDGACLFGVNYASSIGTRDAPVSYILPA